MPIRACAVSNKPDTGAPLTAKQPAAAAGTPGYLPADDWARVVRHAPLVAIDLIVQRADGALLLGRRLNEPARGCWFVPGGAIRKGETLDTAFARIAHDELGLNLARRDATLLGIYEHFYAQNFAGDPGYGTHYVVLAHRLSLTHAQTLPRVQHSDYRWLSPDELLAAPDVHEHCKAYVRS